MQGISSKKTMWLAMLATGALGVLAIVAFTGNASAAHHARGGGAKVKMKFDGKHAPFFDSDSTVKAGSKLTIVNKSNPNKIGPHTFSVVTKDAEKEVRTNKHKCGHFKLKVCKNILKAQQANPETGEVDKPTVDDGKKGWDKGFSDSSKKGDTWFVGKQNDSQSRTVVAKPGTTLYFVCIVHPEMSGKIKVVK